MNNLKLSFKDGPTYSNFKLEVDGSEVTGLTGAALVIRHGESPRLTLDVEIWDSVEIDVAGVVIELGDLRVAVDDIHLVSTLGAMLRDFKKRGLDPKLLEELQA